MFDDSFVGIDFDDDPDALPQASTERDFSVKPRLVLEVLRQEQEGNGHQFEKHLRIFDEETSQESVCILREDWKEMEVLPGDLVHVTGDMSLSHVVQRIVPFIIKI